jgi:uncharacterized membrane protein YkgB
MKWPIFQSEGLITRTADILADKIVDAAAFLIESKIQALATLLPELAGVALVICGLLVMVGNTQKWLGRAGFVAVAGTVLVVIL